MAEQTATEQMRAWVDERVADESVVQIPAIVEEALTYLKRRKPLHDRLVDELFRNTLYELVKQTVRSTRRSYGDGGSAMSDEVLEDRAEHFASRFLGWYERSGDQHVRLLDMTREDLQLAAAERRDRGTHEYQLATLWERLAADLEGGQVVRERFTANEVEALYRSIQDASEGAA